MTETPLNTVSKPSVELPGGYVYGVTRGADLVLRGAHPRRFDELLEALDEVTFRVADMVAGGGGRSQMAARWDVALAERGWGKKNVSVKRVVDDRYVSSDRSHEIDMFAPRVGGETPYPGVACEMQWSNKDPFFDRDLSAFAAFHVEGIVDVGVIVTRGPTLHQTIRRTIPGKYNDKRGRYELKYGETTTHWNKLMPRIERGGGGGCPLLLVGIELERFDLKDKLVAASERAEELFAAGDYGEINTFHSKVADGAIC